VQGRDFILADTETHKPNFGTYTYLIKSYELKDALNLYIDDRSLKYFIFVQIPLFIKLMQSVRNESIHGESTAFKECEKIRNQVVGIGQNSILSELYHHAQLF
jgi:hypothetical protein